MFQSSPLSQEGRYESQSIQGIQGSQFQSSPLSQEGRYREGSTFKMWDVPFQSSPLSQEGRYAPSQRQGARRGCFNPRPSRKRGATRRDLPIQATRRVSILAPLARGALLPAAPMTPRLVSPFQSSPLSQEGRYRQAFLH